jgi:hypothetical protein
MKTFGASIVASSRTTCSGLFSRKVDSWNFHTEQKLQLEGAAARGLEQGERLAEIDVIEVGVAAHQVPRRQRQLVEVRARRGVAGQDLAVGSVDRETGHLREVAAPLQGLDQGRHDLLAVSHRDQVDRRVREPRRVARGVVAADQDDGLRQDLFHPPGEAHGAVALGGEVALDADQVGGEAAAAFDAVVPAVDPQVEDGALVAPRLEHAGDAGEPERLDEGDHLEAEDARAGRLEQGDAHGGSPRGGARYAGR